MLHDPIDASVLEAAEGLPGLRQYGGRLQQHRRGGGDPAGILVTNTPGVLTEATADLTWP